MRRFRIAVLACAVAAALAAPAGAHEFKGPPASAPAVAVADGPQTFLFKPFRVTCEKATSNGAAVASNFPSQTLTLEMTYRRCTTHAGKVAKTEGPGIPTRFLGPVTLTYHANGFIEVGSIAIAVGGDFKCNITTEEQTIPSKAVKKPTEEFTATSFTDELVATKSKKLPMQSQVVLHNNAVKGIHFTLSEGFCEELEMTEGKGGSYSGALKADVKNTNLLWN
jgi:hypothetical protein